MHDLTGLTASSGPIRLRMLESGDESAFIELLESSASFWAPWTPALTLPIPPRERFRRERARAELTAVAGTHLRLGGFDETGALVGLFALNEIARGVLESAHASWQVGALAIGRGYGRAGTKALLSLAFSASPGGLGLHRVQANIMPSNDASIALARSVGFREEGLAKGLLKIAGKWEDHVMFALTSEDWPITG